MNWRSFEVVVEFLIDYRMLDKIEESFQMQETPEDKDQMKM